MSKRLVYLDYAAATPLDTRVLAAMQPYFSKNFYNPSASYLESRKVKSSVEEARNRVASILGAKSSEIIFTAGGSEANNLAISGVMNSNIGSNIVISAIEHPSIKEPSANFKHKLCPVNKEGLLDRGALKKLIDDNTALVSIIYANNEIGVIQRLSEIASIIKEVRASRLERGVSRPLYLHSDACQAANYLDLHVSRLGVDLMTLNGGKIYGPKQSGVLFVKSGVKLRPLIFGGGQERGLRSGTENVAAIVGFATALKLVQEGRHLNSIKTHELQKYFIQVLQRNFPDCIINGSLKYRIVNNLHLSFPGLDNETLLIKLDNEGIMAAAGSACSASSSEPSSVLGAIGLSDNQARSSIRFSLGKSSTKADIDLLISTLLKLQV